MIVRFAATALASDATRLATSDEHVEVALFTAAELDDLVLPPGYRTAIARSAALGGQG